LVLFSKRHRTFSKYGKSMTSDRESAQRDLETALRLAVRYHTGQRDKEGEAYLLHLLRVMMSGATPAAKQVGLLHDLLEDTPATLAELRESGLSLEVIDAIEGLTKPNEMNYSEYIVRLSGNALAREVKLADLRDNYAIHRVPYRVEHEGEDSDRIQRYVLAYQFLTNAIDEGEFRERMTDVDAI